MKSSLLIAIFVSSACGPKAGPVVPAPAPAPAAPAPARQLISVEQFVAAVHPMCFWSNEEKTELAGCDDKLAGELSAEGDGATFEPESPEWGHGSSYTVLGVYPTGVLVSYSYNSGGTGNFTGLGLYDRDDTHLILKRNIHAGDRCHGGVIEHSVDGDTLTFSAAVTPAEVIRIGGKKLSRDDYELFDSANSCAGSITVEASLSSAKSRRASVDLEADTSSGNCFDAVLAAHLGANPEPKLDALAGEYAAQCKGR